MILFFFSRGTDQFSVYVSDQAEGDWTHIVTDQIPSVFHLGPNEDIPLHSFDIKAKGRYVKVTLDSYFHSGAGLRYVNVNIQCESTSTSGNSLDILHCPL